MTTIKRMKRPELIELIESTIQNEEDESINTQVEDLLNYYNESKEKINKFRKEIFGYKTKEALEIIYANENKEIKDNVISLINTLIEKGISTF